MAIFLHFVRWASLGALLSMSSGCGECEDDYACPSTQICSVETNQCVAKGCRQDRECAPGFRCQNNRCLEQTPKMPPGDVSPVPADKAPVDRTAMVLSEDKTAPSPGSD